MAHVARRSEICYQSLVPTSIELLRDSRQAAVRLPLPSGKMSRTGSLQGEASCTKRISGRSKGVLPTAVPCPLFSSL